MKTLPSKVCKLLMATLLIMFINGHLAKAQTIVIDSTFTTNVEIFPFSPTDTIFGLNLSGNVSLNSDTSLVRITFVDNNSEEYLLYEAYPYIVDDWDFNIFNEADETKYLNSTQPYSIKVQIVNSSFEFVSLLAASEYTDFTDSLQLIHKEAMETAKVSQMSNNIQQHQMIWFAAETSVSQLSYAEKKKLFGENYNMLGLDYYAGGVYDPVPGVGAIEEESTLVEEFDWRNRHGANNPDKEDFYYDGDASGSGWLTSVKDQNSHTNCKGLCYIYGPLAVVEGLANIYFNSHLDFDLSEQHVLDCDNHTNDECSGGPAGETISFLTNSPGVVNEECYPMAAPNGSCQPFPNPGLLEYQIRTPYGTSAASIWPHTADQKRESIILHGPMIAWLGGYVSDMAHYLALIGYGKLNVNDFFHINPNIGNDTIHVGENSQYIGRSYWIYKNSWGTNWGDQGYMYHVESQFLPEFCKYFNLPIEDFLNLGRPIECFDKDDDGYFNWGISEQKPNTCPTCPNDKDSDDSEPRIGPYDVSYYGTPVRPIMEVTCENEQIDNDGFFTFYETSQDREFIITISNQGNAQLNLVDPTFEDIVTSSNEPVFEIFSQPPDNTIEMEVGSTQFIILYHYDPEQSFDQAVITINTLEPEYGAYEFIIANVDCDQSPSPDINITVAETWDSQDIIFGNVYVHSGAELTIEGTYGFIDGIDLNIKPGGRVIIDGGVLTNVCDNTWQGIDVWGDDDLSQYPTSNQGYLNIMNGGKIQNAAFGIQVANANGDITYARGTTGGIVKCDSAIFLNNTYDIIIYPYQNINPGTGGEAPNFCTFRNTFFISEGDFYGTESHVRLKGVDGVKFRGCTFENKIYLDNYFTDYKKGTGIESLNSGFYVEDYCTSNTAPCNSTKRCLFKNLDYGIYATNSPTDEYIFIDTTIFLNNLTGIYMSAVDEQRITSNEFMLDHFVDLTAYSNPEPVGLYLEACKYYMVQENFFQNGSSNEYSTGIHILNSGQDANEVYNNSFEGFLSGITAAGENRDEEGTGLCLKCNNFRNCITDIGVTPEEDGFGDPILGPTIGIASTQGESTGLPNGPAGNTFTENPIGNNYQNHLDCGHIDYIHHDAFEPPRKIVPEPISLNITPYEDEDNDYLKETACPSNLSGGIDIPAEMAVLTTEKVQITAYADTLSLLVDGGDTDDLNLEIQTSFPDEALQIRQELLIESPYLSDTVMETAIYKENVLPNVMIRDILVANPQSAKSHEVLNALDDRFVPMPDYMMDEIMQGQYIYGAKELLVQKLAKHKSIRGKSMAMLLRHYKSDTLNITASTDSIVSLLQNEDHPAAQYQLSILYLKQVDSLNAFSTLYVIPNDYNLTSSEEFIHALYEDLLEIQWQMKYDTAGIDSLQIQELFDIADHHRSLPGIYARNILINEELLVYKEPIYFPDFLKSFPVYENQNKKSPEENLLRLFPNPAGTFFIMEYDLREYEGESFVFITDMNGKVMDRFHLYDKQNQQVISTENFPAGMYIVQLLVDLSSVASEKIVISK